MNISYKQIIDFFHFSVLCDLYKNKRYNKIYKLKEINPQYILLTKSNSGNSDILEKDINSDNYSNTNTIYDNKESYIIKYKYTQNTPQLNLDVLHRIAQFLPDSLAIKNFRLTSHTFKNLIDKEYSRFFTPRLINYVLNTSNILNSNNLFFNFNIIKSLKEPPKQFSTIVNNIIHQLENDYLYNLSFKDKDFKQTYETLKYLLRKLPCKENLTLNINLRQCEIPTDKIYLLCKTLIDLSESSKAKINIDLSSRQIHQILISQIDKPYKYKLDFLLQYAKIINIDNDLMYILELKDSFDVATKSLNFDIITQILNNDKIKTLCVTADDKKYKETINPLLANIIKQCPLHSIETLDLSRLDIRLVNTNTLNAFLSKVFKANVKEIILGAINYKIFFHLLEELKILDNETLPKIITTQPAHYNKFIQKYSTTFKVCSSHLESYRQTIKTMTDKYKKLGIDIQNNIAAFNLETLQQNGLLQTIKHTADHLSYSYNPQLFELLKINNPYNIKITGEQHTTKILIDDFLYALSQYSRHNKIKITGIEINLQNKMKLNDVLKQPAYLCTLIKTAGKNLNYINLGHEANVYEYSSLVKSLKQIEQANFPDNEEISKNVSNLEYLALTNFNRATAKFHPINGLEIIFPSLDIRHN